MTELLPTASEEEVLNQLDTLSQQAREAIVQRRDAIRSEAAEAERLRARARVAERSALRLPSGACFSFSYEANFSGGGRIYTWCDTKLRRGYLCGGATLTVSFGASRMACALELEGGDDGDGCEWEWDAVDYYRLKEDEDAPPGGDVVVELYSPADPEDASPDATAARKGAWLASFPERGPIDVHTRGLNWSGSFMTEWPTFQSGPPALTGVPKFHLEFRGAPHFKPASITHVSSCVALWVLSHAAASCEELGLNAEEVVARVDEVVDAIFEEAWATVRLYLKNTDFEECGWMGSVPDGPSGTEADEQGSSGAAEDDEVADDSNDDENDAGTMSRKRARVTGHFAEQDESSHSS